MKRLMKTKISVVKLQNLIVNHKSRPVNSNPAKFCLQTNKHNETNKIQLISGHFVIKKHPLITSGYSDD